ncbi:MAG: hypothetical protein ABIE23_03240 [archaeon]
MSVPVEELIKQVSSLPLKEALALLVVNKVLEFSGKGYSALKQIIIDKYNEGKYAFVPNKEEAQKLTEFETSSTYKQIKILVPSYRYIDIIRTGLLIDFYHCRNLNGDKERVFKIKQSIANTPNGKTLLKITNLPSTPFFSIILKYLYDLKINNNYSEKQLEETFDETILQWKESSKFVENKHSVQSIINFCTKQIESDKSPIFLLAMRQAVTKLNKAIETLERKNFFKANNYIKRIIILEEGNHPRVEVMLIKE